MKILIDTSILSLVLRRKKTQADNSVAKALQNFIASGERMFIMGIILQEILQGIRHHEQFKKLKLTLEAYPLLEPTRATYESAANLYNACRQSGIQIATVDCLIAAVAVENDCHLFTADHDFQQISHIAQLRLLGF